MNTQKKNTLEEDYFHKRDAQLRAKLKAEEQASAFGLKDTHLASALIEAGFNPDSMRALLFVPLIETAWADDELHPTEREEVLNFLKNRGVETTSEAHHLVSLWLQKPPTDALYIKARNLLSPVISELKTTAHEDPNWILEGAKRVASATGCTLNKIGIWGKISLKEEKVLKEIANRLS